MYHIRWPHVRRNWGQGVWGGSLLESKGLGGHRPPNGVSRQLKKRLPFFHFFQHLKIKLWCFRWTDPVRGRVVNAKLDNSFYKWKLRAKLFLPSVRHPKIVINPHTMHIFQCFFEHSKFKDLTRFNGTTPIARKPFTNCGLSSKNCTHFRGVEFQFRR